MPRDTLEPAALRLARRAKGVATRAARRLSPLRLLPGRATAYRDSWRDRAVAAQMLELSARELERADEVRPYRAFHDLLETLVRQSGLPSPARFLDIGCGSGAYGELLERWAPGCFEYVGADYSEEVVAAARERRPQRTFVVRDLFEEGALDGYDVVFASALVDVLADYEPALNALLAADAPFVLLHRQRLARRPRFELARGYAGQRTYRSYVTRPLLDELAAAHGRRVVASVPVDGDVHSFLLVRS